MGDEQMARARADLAKGARLDDVAAEYNLTSAEIVVLIREWLDGKAVGFDGYEKDPDGR